MSTGESLKGERVSAVRAERVDSSVALKSPSFGDVDRGNPDMRQNHEEHFPIVCSCVKQDQAESVALRHNRCLKNERRGIFRPRKIIFGRDVRRNWPDVR
jgi:hypothetical protein